MEINRHDPQIVAREERWQERVTNELPALLSTLLESEKFGLIGDRDLPPAAYGVYLLSEKGAPRYVGRAGLTERSRQAGKGFSNFRTRLLGHIRPRHNEGTYAYKRAVRAFERKRLPLGKTRKANCESSDFMDEFRRQCLRVASMDFQIVEINENRLAAVFEIYAATVLGLRHQTFAVS